MGPVVVAAGAAAGFRAGSAVKLRKMHGGKLGLVSVVLFDGDIRSRCPEDPATGMMKFENHKLKDPNVFSVCK